MTSHRKWPQAIERLSTKASQWAASTTALVSAIALVTLWMGAGPLFGYSARWLLTINTVTSVVTFVMVFLIQRAQSKDTLAMHIKLSELLTAVRDSVDEMIAVEDLSEEELHRLHARYVELARRADGRLAANKSPATSGRTN
jgi:low affinity Fe/Cu permease